MRIRWSEEKNELIKRTHGVCFEQVFAEIEAGRFLGPEDNPSRPGQRRIVVKVNGYPVAVPFVVEADGGWFLKTAYLCRRMKGRI